MAACVRLTAPSYTSIVMPHSEQQSQQTSTFHPLLVVFFNSCFRLVSARLVGSTAEQRVEINRCDAVPCRPLAEITLAKVPRDLLAVVLDAFATAEMLASD